MVLLIYKYMNYKKLYNTFIEYCKNTTLRERLTIRNKKDARLNDEYIYSELHHINPKHDIDNTNEDVVRLLPEEHVFAHKIRWKAFKQRGDILAVRFCLNGFQYNKNRKIMEVKNEYRLTKSLLQGYAWIKHNSAVVRNTHGWHTKDGTRRISDARKGTMPVKDSITNKMIGAVSVNHPNVLSGVWVHHSKGTKLSEERKAKCARHGEKNGRYSGYTDEQLLNIAHAYILKNGRIDKKMYDEFPKFPKTFSKFRFKNYNDTSGMRRFKMAYEDKFNEAYPVYIKTEEHKRKLSVSIRRRHKIKGSENDHKD